MREPSSLQPARIDRLTVLALALASGIAIGKLQPWPIVWPWLAVSAGLVVLAALPRTRVRIAALPLAAGAMLALGAAWHTTHTEYVASNDLAALLGEHTGVVRVTGVAETAPELHRQTNASLAQFGYRTPSTYFPARIDGIEREDGEIVHVRGKMLISIAEPIAPFRAGERFTATGHFNAFSSPRNPGELNRRELAKSLKQSGALHLPRRELLETESLQQTEPRVRWLSWRERLQQRADGLLLADLPATETVYRGSLLKALLLGQREPDLYQLNEAFRRLGIAHFLAISGLHLGIVAAFFIMLARYTGGARRWQAIALIALVLGYLAMIEVRLPVMRAGIMTIAVCAGFALHRRLGAAGLVALSGIALLLWQPDQLFWPGFQLSFGVVLGLLHLTPHLRSRWFGPSNTEAATGPQMAMEWLKDATAVAFTAWFVATPIIAFHFGIISPLGIPLAIVGVPLVALLLALGYAKMILALVLPSAAIAVGLLLSVVADFIIIAVMAIDSVPGTVVHVPFPSEWWAVTALGFLWLILARPVRLPRGTTRLGICVLALWLWWPALRPADYALRIDMISVGHGACFVVRSGGETLVFDAGSNTQLDAGTRWIIPAVRRLGVRSVDTIVISHPHIDHYAAVLELVEEFRPKRIYVTHQLREHALEFPHTAVAYLSDQLVNRHRLPPRPIVAGETRRLGKAELTWLHPPENLADFGRDNQQSMVIRIEVADRVVLLTGDVERAGMASLLANNPDLRADVLEMPHHGAWHDLTSALLDRVRPSIVLQSSSRTQWERDRWQSILDDLGAERFVTYRDGATWVEIKRDGTIRTGTFRNN